jgi:hypothetical protein
MELELKSHWKISPVVAVYHIIAMAAIFIYFIYSFNDAVSSDYVMLNGALINESWIGMDVEGSSCRVFQDAIVASACKDSR